MPVAMACSPRRTNGKRSVNRSTDSDDASCAQGVPVRTRAYAHFGTLRRSTIDFATSAREVLEHHAQERARAANERGRAGATPTRPHEMRGVMPVSSELTGPPLSRSPSHLLRLRDV